MHLVQMRPEELKDAVYRNVPLLMAAGVVEYHGPHLPIGTDFLIANAICEAVEQRCECVLAPPLPFGPTMSWAGGADEGEMDFDREAFFSYAKESLRGMMNMGFGRIYVLQHHQGLEGLQSLALRRAGSELIREVAKTFGEGWGRKLKDTLPQPNIFQWIKVAQVDTFSKYPGPFPGPIPIGHAGKGETQLIWAAYPDTVRLPLLDTWDGPLPRWLTDANQATEEEGRKWLEFCIQGWVDELSPRGPAPKTKQG